MEKTLIGLVAPKQSGKDTIGDYLCGKYSFKKYNFADPLKEGVRKIFGFTEEQLYGNEKEIIDPFWGVSPREVLQKMGTEVFQYEVPKTIPELNDVGRSFWVKCFEKWYKEESVQYEKVFSVWSNSIFEAMCKGLPYDFLNVQPHLRVVISDIRFHHEANKIKDLGGTLIRVKRNTKENLYSKHKSEIECQEIVCDYTIENNSNINELYSSIDLLIKNFVKVQDI
jgi:hypothetical protein